MAKGVEFSNISRFAKEMERMPCWDGYGAGLFERLVFRA
jgi:hypothetical protein